LAKAFVLINVQTGTEDKVIKQLKAAKNVSEAYFVYGVYDFIVTVIAPSTDELKDSVLGLRKISEITSTLTMMVIE